uniref:Ankyrin repeat domain 52 n=1 Tax=Microcebus murinus TaxID=30608 RepID=A0A8C5VK70_MICMU
MGILSITDQPPLVQAIFSRDVEEVRSLLSQKENINVLDQERRTPLHAAAYVGDVPILQLLLMSGESVASRERGKEGGAEIDLWCLVPGEVPASSRFPGLKVLGLLLAHSADVNARDKLWQTPLHVAAANRATKCAEALAPLLSSLNVADRSGRSALHHAVHSGHLETVNLLLNKGASLNVCDKKERQPLHWAAFLGHLEVLKLLVARGADLGCKDRKGYGLLHTAAASGQIEVVKYLLRMGAEIDEPNAFGNTALHIACYLGQDAVAIELVNAGANVNQPNDKGFTPLHVAAVSTNGALCLELLVNNGADVNYQSKEGKSPLHMAAIHGRFTRSQILIQNGSEIDCADKFGNTPLHVAARYGHELLISTLMTNGADTARRGIHDMFPLHLAVLFGFSDCCRKLLSSGQLYSIVSSLSNEHVLSAGFDINTPDNLGRTCLHAAASGGNVECLNLLLSSGADLRRRDKFGRTPLHYAAANGSYQCAVTLVTAGAGVNEADCKGCSPLHYAAASDTYRRAEPHTPSSHDAEEDEPLKESRRKEAFFCLEFLLDNGADPSLRDRQGYTAVHYAAAYGNRQNLELLLEMSFNCLEDVESTIPVSPLHLAAYNGHCEALKTLAETLVNLDVRDHKGRTALFLATERGSTECVEVLTAHGASALIKERKRKWTPLHAAAASGHTDSLHLLIDSGERADITDVMDAYGQTPLMLAIMNGHVDCVHLLLEKGSTADAADLRGRTALHRGAVTGCEDCLAALLDHDAFVLCRDFKGRTPIHLASACGHTAVLRTLLQAALSTDPLDAGVDYSGYSPMHWASYTGHEDCLELLLEHSPFSYLEGNPFTPLHCAVINNQDSTTEMLLGALGAKIVNSRDAKGRTPLHAAAFADNVSGLRMLLQHQAEVNATDHTGRTALMTAAENGQTAAVEFLLYRGKADLTVLDENKNTALHLACSKGHEKCALMILAETQDLGLINATNSALQMPLHIAARNGLASVVQALLSRGATVLAVDEEGHTPALACAPNKDVADCLALILSTMKPFPPKDAVSPFSFSLLKNCGIAAAKTVGGCGALPHGASCPYSQERHGAIGLDGCYSE